MGDVQPIRWGITVHEKPEPGDEDLLNVAAIHTFLRGGVDFGVPTEDVPGGGVLAVSISCPWQEEEMKGAIPRKFFSTRGSADCRMKSLASHVEHFENECARISDQNKNADRTKIPAMRPSCPNENSPTDSGKEAISKKAVFSQCCTLFVHCQLRNID